MWYFYTPAGFEKWLLSPVAQQASSLICTATPWTVLDVSSKLAPLKNLHFHFISSFVVVFFVLFVSPFYLIPAIYTYLSYVHRSMIRWQYLFKIHIILPVNQCESTVVQNVVYLNFYLNLLFLRFLMGFWLEESAMCFRLTDSADLMWREGWIMLQLY